MLCLIIDGIFYFTTVVAPIENDKYFEALGGREGNSVKVMHGLIKETGV